MALGDPCESVILLPSSQEGLSSEAKNHWPKGKGLVNWGWHTVQGGTQRWGTSYSRPYLGSVKWQHLPH